MSIQQETRQKNLRLLIQLRWLAVGGQMITIAVVHGLIGVQLPVTAMGIVLLVVMVSNVAAMGRLRGGADISDRELFIGLLVDVFALTAYFYLSGGASNPFIFLLLLQVILAAVLLGVRYSLVMAGVTVCCFIGLSIYHLPLDLPHSHEADPFDLHVQGMLICFVLIAALLVVLIARIDRNVEERDRKLAELRRRSDEEDHAVRIGLLATGAAHELGTPLATLSVILNDWRRLDFLRKDADALQELAVMESELERCKSIISRILMASGEIRGEGAARTTARAFLDDLVAEWRSTRMPKKLEYRNHFLPDAAIVSDVALKQVILNVFDNALDASPDWVHVEAWRKDDRMLVVVRDAGPGFAPEMLENFGRPYHSTKKQPEGGLGLFLVVNVLRQLGGSAQAVNVNGGAEVTLSLPIVGISPGA